ncbi:MAG: hypothetical protein K8J08_10085 [Thermoanaerobaculia bacterium]|nr:hypothetical protein [Thermoanaerobaculia bacterium]
MLHPLDPIQIDQVLDAAEVLVDADVRIGAIFDRIDFDHCSPAQLDRITNLVDRSVVAVRRRRRPLAVVGEGDPSVC